MNTVTAFNDHDPVTMLPYWYFEYQCFKTVKESMDWITAKFLWAEQTTNVSDNHFINIFCRLSMSPLISQQHQG